jgi:hypothetical protein
MAKVEAALAAACHQLAQVDLEGEQQEGLPMMQPPCMEKRNTRCSCCRGQQVVMRLTDLGSLQLQVLQQARPAQSA